MYRLENDFFYICKHLFTHSFIHAINGKNKKNQDSFNNIKVQEGITFVAGYFFLTMLVKLVLTTIVSHIGKTTSM